jgi:tetratricopeptide (TPR) repeat protein
VRRFLIVLALLAVAPAPSHARSSYGDVARVVRALDEWRFDDARKLVADLEKTSADSPETQFLEAQVAFNDGDYPRARGILETLKDSAVKEVVKDLLPLVTATDETTTGFEKRETSGKHFVIYYSPGKDELLLDLADEALEAAYAQITVDLGWTPPSDDGPIRVELLPKVTDLARVSTLTEKEIETSGTIALCKYNKLMVVTPRATLLGYPWLDTMAHEFTHYVITRATDNRVPIWMQEGLAKFEETRWRAQPGQPGMSRLSEHLLATALKRGRLITFEEMHPSMAKLPSQEAAATAFAEVYSIVAWMHGKVGYDGIRSALKKIKDGKTERRAVAEVMGGTWEQVEADWRKALKAQNLKQDVAIGKTSKRLRLKKSDSQDDENAGLDQVSDERARKFVRLGGLLRARGRFKAAAAEYEKALAITGTTDAYVAAKLARTYLEMGDPKKAIEIAGPLAERDEEDAGPQATLGAAYLQSGDATNAEVHLVLAVRVSPFDPEVRCGLAEVYTSLGDEDHASREQAACRALRK